MAKDVLEPIMWYVRRKIENKILDWTPGKRFSIELTGPELEVANEIAAIYKQKGWTVIRSKRKTTNPIVILVFE